MSIILVELLTNQILVSKYQLYLPDREVLEAQIKRVLESEKEG